MTLGVSPAKHRPTTFSYDCRALRVGQALLSLTRDQADILFLLHRKFGEIVTNDELISGKYGQQEPQHAYFMVRKHIWALRKILDHSVSRWEIVTELRKGVRLREMACHEWP